MVGWLMADLFPLYLSYAPDSFPFEWLEKTKDLEMRCRDTTGEKINFPTIPELLEAIHKSQRVIAPEKSRGLPSDWGFSGFMKGDIYEVLKELPFTKALEFSGPLFDRLHYGIIIKSYPRVKGVKIFYLHPNHWSCMIQDHSSAVDERQQENGRDYLLRGELLAVTSIFYRQMNGMVWHPEEDRYRAKPIYKEGFLTATVVTFIRGKYA